jgi:hypothetical protein
MRKVYCDKCEEDITDKNINNVKFKVHFRDILKESLHPGYTDGEGNYTSGKTIGFDLCNKCYNEIMYPAFQALSVSHKDDKGLKKVDVDKIKRL